MVRGQPGGVLPASSGVPDFLLGGGEMGALMRAHDWSSSPLGSPAGWPQSLRTVVRLMLNTGHPMYIWWGPELGCLYNDAYRESIGPERHPASLGRAARAVWAEIWPIIGPQIDQVMSGRGATWHVDQLVPITRHGRLDEVYWTYSYSPIDDESAACGIGGVLVVCTETTQQVLAARRLSAERDRLKQLFEQAPIFMALLDGPSHRIELANPGYMQLVGHRPVIGRTVAEALPEAVEQGYLALLDSVFERGRPYAASGAKYDLQPVAGGPVAERFLDFVYQPIADAEGRVTGIFVLGVDVTERTRADALLRESEAQFRSALKAGRMGSWETDRSTMTRLWSDEGMALFGLDLPGGRGKVGGPDDEYVASLHPDDRHLADRFYELAAAQDSFAADYRIVRPDGATLFLSGRGLVVARERDGRPKRLVSIMADVTDARQAQERLRVERDRLSLALTAGQMGAYDLDIDEGVLWWSPETYALFGVSPATFVPTPESVLDLLHPEDRGSFVQRRAEAIARREPFVHEFRVQRGEAEIWVGFRGQAEYDGAGRLVRTFGVVMDITDRKLAEQILRDAARQKDNFIAMLSHELRNPLAPIRNAINVLRHMAPTDPRVGWCHDVIDRQTAQMAHLLDDLLDVSRLSRSQLTLRLRRLQIATALEQAIEIAQPLIEAASHRLTVAMPDEPLALTGDLTRLAQVLSNVLINAAKYTPRGGEIAVTVERQGDAASVKVRDSGIGIAAEHIPQIFEMFGQVESARDRSQGGQGIGLALARGLVEMHGGTIEVRSEGAGKGSEFEIRLPLARD
ncbi:MAG: ATP-binding protein [Pseudomonadota bacterium]|nr:ATP-binding protein [Pseudomonadota bacterium]